VGVKRKKIERVIMVYRTVKRQAFLVRIDEAERNLTAGKTKSKTVDEVIASV
jgi:hypothetical protein